VQSCLEKQHQCLPLEGQQHWSCLGMTPTFTFGGETMTFAFGEAMSTFAFRGGMSMFAIEGATPMFAFGGGTMTFTGRVASKEMPEQVDIVEDKKRGAHCWREWEV
jgi:hypothetical protein